MFLEPHIQRMFHEVQDDLLLVLEFLFRCEANNVSKSYKSELKQAKLSAGDVLTMSNRGTIARKLHREESGEFL